MGFVHLHNHSEYSLLDGAVRFKDLMARCQATGQTAVALTDHGSMAGYWKFMEEAHKADIKPLVGCEFYLAEHNAADRDEQHKIYHLVLLAKNKTGLDNLVALSSRSFMEGYYYKPRIDKAMIEQHREGLICLSACLNGEVNYLLRKGETARAEAAFDWYSKQFGEDYFVELHNHGLPEEEEARRKLAEAARARNLPLVATNDIHYLDATDVPAHDAKLAIQTGRFIDEEKRFKFDSAEFYFKTEEQMRSLFPETPQAVDNTLEVASRVNLEKPGGKRVYYFPTFTSDMAGETEEQAFDRLCAEGLGRRYPGDKTEALARLKMETDIIKSMGFVGYFLILWDIVRAARERDIFVGPGRGSAAGSIVAYVLHITDVDPLRYGLLFERFLNPERISMPDIDMDFEDSRRREVFDYTSQRYGENNVAQISTFATMKTKAVIKDVGRVLRIPYSKMDAFIKAIPPEAIDEKLPLTELLKKAPTLAEMVGDDEELKKVFTLAGPLRGLNRTQSVHAAGVVIGDGQLPGRVPLCLAKGDTFTRFTTQVSMEDVEALGLVKMDFLGIRTLTVLKEALRMAGEKEGRTIGVQDIPLDDPAIYKLFQEGRTEGIFQFESDGMRKLLRETRPTSVEQLTALNALFRPGPLESGMTGDFTLLIQGKKKVSYLHPDVADILQETFGVIVYQEQVMQIGNRLAEMSLGQVDLMRKAMGKKKKEEMDKVRVVFVEGCVNNKTTAHPISAKKAGEIFDLIEKFAGYGFNKSHSVSYAILAAQTAWVKAHYPEEYMAALLNGYMDKRDDLNAYVAVLKEDGIRLLPPHVNHSSLYFHPAEGGIRYGLAGIKNVGEAASEAILRAREEGGPFKDVEDLLLRVDLRAVNRKTIESLLRAGAFDGLRGHAGQWLAALDALLPHVQGVRAAREKSRDSLFGDDETLELPPFQLQEAPSMPLGERLQHEEELLGLFISGHPLDEYEGVLSRVPHRKIADLWRADGGLSPDTTVTIAGLLTGVNHKTSKNGRGFAFLQVEDTTGSIEAPVFGEVYTAHRDKLEKKNLVKIVGKLQFKQAFRPGSDQEDAPLTPQVMADYVELLEHEEKPPTALVLEVSPFLSEEEIRQLLATIGHHVGQGQVVLQVMGDTPLRRVRLPEAVGVELSQEARRALLSQRLCQAAYFE